MCVGLRVWFNFDRNRVRGATHRCDMVYAVGSAQRRCRGASDVDRLAERNLLVYFYPDRAAFVVSIYSSLYLWGVFVFIFE